MKVIETVTTVIDTDEMRRNFEKHACGEELQTFMKWLKRLETEGSLFVRKRTGMTIKEYQSVMFHRFEIMVDLSTTSKRLECRFED